MYKESRPARIAPIVEKLCVFDLSSTQVSFLSAIGDEALEKFRRRPLGKEVYLYLEADYQKVRHDGQVRDVAVLKAARVHEQGKREILDISCYLSEAEVHWRTFLEELLSRGLKGVKMITSDDHRWIESRSKGNPSFSSMAKIYFSSGATCSAFCA